MLSLLSTLLLIAGFSFAVKDVIFPQAAQINGIPDQNKTGLPEEVPGSLPSDSKELSVTAIGDSLAKGTGDDSGKGIARRTVELLKEQGAESKLVNNLGINGLTTEGLKHLLDEKGVQYSLRQADLIVLSIGGNDLFDGAQNLQSGRQLPSEQELEQSVTQASDQFAAAIAKLNPFSDLPMMREIGNGAVARWNNIVTNILSDYEKVVMVPTFDLFAQNSAKYLASDHFHPNGTGYQIIAERILQSAY
ncbi:Spore germination lipase LipC [compost metagenome]